MHLSHSQISPSIWGIQHCNSSPHRAVLLFVGAEEEEGEGICLRISNPRCRLVYGNDSLNSISHSHCVMSVSPMMLLMVESAYRENSSSFIVSSSPPSFVGIRIPASGGNPDRGLKNISAKERVTSVKGCRIVQYPVHTVRIIGLYVSYTYVIVMRGLPVYFTCICSSDPLISPTRMSVVNKRKEKCNCTQNALNATT